MNLARPECAAATFSTTGASIRHGPHQGAQKSTRTGWSLERTSRWNVAWVTSGSALMVDSLPRQEETAGRGARLHARFRRAAGPRDRAASRVATPTRAEADTRRPRAGTSRGDSDPD